MQEFTNRKAISDTIIKYLNMPERRKL